jgi:hypothetical protein
MTSLAYLGVEYELGVLRCARTQQNRKLRAIGTPSELEWTWEKRAGDDAKKIQSPPDILRFA